MSAGRQLLRVLTDAAPVGVEVGYVGMRPWASALFTGARHRLVLGWAGETPTAWLATLPDWEAPLVGHVAIDCVVRARREDGAELEFLIIEDA